MAGLCYATRNKVSLIEFGVLNALDGNWHLWGYGNMIALTTTTTIITHHHYVCTLPSSRNSSSPKAEHLLKVSKLIIWDGSCSRMLIKTKEETCGTLKSNILIVARSITGHLFFVENLIVDPLHWYVIVYFTYSLVGGLQVCKSSGFFVILGIWGRWGNRVMLAPDSPLL